MELYIDADGCPVTNIAIALAVEHGISCTLICDTSHEIRRDGARTITVSKGADSADFRLVNLVQKGDVVVTQDYGLASMCLARQAIVLHQDGWQYTQDNIGALLFQRSESRKFRASGGRIKGPAKRTKDQDKKFEQTLYSLIQQAVQG